MKHLAVAALSCALIGGCGSPSHPSLPKNCDALVSKLKGEGSLVLDTGKMTELSRSNRSLTCDLDGDGELTGDYAYALLEANLDANGNPVCHLTTKVAHCPTNAITCGTVPFSLITAKGDPCD